MSKHEEMATTRGRRLALQWWQEDVLLSPLDFEGLVRAIDSALSHIEQETEARVLEIAMAACKEVYGRRKADGLLGFNAIMQCVDAIRALTKNLPTSPKSVADTDLSVSGEVIDGWRDIATAPRDGTHILLWNKDDGMHEGWWDKAEYNEGWYTFIVYSESWTHWMPIPAAPDAPNDEGK